MFSTTNKTLTLVAVARNFITPLVFVLPIFIAYLLAPDSFLYAWKGRIPYVFFLWLLLLEFALAWRKISEKGLSTQKRAAAIAIAAGAAPTTYIIAAFLLGLNRQFVELGNIVGVPPESWFLQYSWPLSLEYLFLTAFFTIFLLLVYKSDGLKWFSVSMFFLGATGFFYLVDTFYPYGTQVVLQSFVPVAASTTAYFLGCLGYSAQFATFNVRRVIDSLSTTEQIPLFMVSRGTSRFSVIIYWPCAGVQGLFIYTFAILLFLRGLSVSRWRKVIYFSIGLAGTFLINVLRLVAISMVGVNSGSAAAQLFHSYFGELFFITWLLVYLLMIIFGRRIRAALTNAYGFVCGYLSRKEVC